MDKFIFFLVVLATIVAVQCQCLRHKGAVAISPFDYFLFGDDKAKPETELNELRKL